jgi:hypothetical protein
VCVTLCHKALKQFLVYIERKISPLGSAGLNDFKALGFITEIYEIATLPKKSKRCI